MTDVTEYLAEQKRLAKAASEGPWGSGIARFGYDAKETPYVAPEVGSNVVAQCYATPSAKADAEFIAAARESVPRMIAALEAVLDECQSAVRAQEAPLSPRMHGGDPFPARIAAGDVIRAIEAALGGESNGE